MQHECECGEPTDNPRDGCDRCRFLDGGKLMRYVDALRHSYVATVYDVATQCKCPVRVAHRGLSKLEQQGRVERFSGAGRKSPITFWRLVERAEVAA